MIKTVQKPKYILSIFSGCLSYYETDNSSLKNFLFYPSFRKTILPTPPTILYEVLGY